MSCASLRRVGRNVGSPADMRLTYLYRGTPLYPRPIQKYLGAQAPRTVACLGNTGLLRGRTLALFCSVRCPGDVILKTYDLVRSLRDKGTTVIAGFHSPMEKECLRILLRGKQPLIICPARSVERLRAPPEWHKPLRQGRLLVLSPFAEKYRRVTTEVAVFRNEFVAALADRVFIAYAAPGGKTEQLARRIARWGKCVLTSVGGTSSRLVRLGAKPGSRASTCEIHNGRS